MNNLYIQAVQSNIFTLCATELQYNQPTSCLMTLSFPQSSCDSDHRDTPHVV